MKIPVKVWKNIVKLQRRLLWGGSKKESKISWVSWANVCKPKAAGDWFSEGVGKKVGNGLLTSFWFEPWSGGTLLREQYSRLFQVSQQRDSKVGEMGNWVNGEWKWDLLWRKELFVWEEDLLENLMGTLNVFHISNAQDLWVWKHDATGIFSFKLAYYVLVSNLGVRVASLAVTDQVLARVWKSWAPSKVIVFS
ncbi:hypothetical protein A2U01_0015856 [Trifolium medium]|uniref:Uncharacterized protein n=1 Tax=Trifolium medium TaxID=97028 RepID=A0A392N511_9FABA|nr:hypothetical protein [Trifolium medium]